MPASPLQPDWRDPAPYRQLRGIDRGGLMWEWLRRDPAYIAWYRAGGGATRDRTGDRGDPLVWGLHFRRGPGLPVARRARDLARRRRS